MKYTTQKPIVILGKTNSGKSTVQKMLEKFNITPIITTTTRPKRYYEIDTIDYNFVSYETFQDLINENYFAEYTQYNTYDDNNNKCVWYYGSPKHLYKPNSCIVLNPKGLDYLKKNKIDCFSVYLDVDETSIIQKQIERKDNPIEANRRLHADRKDFKNIYNKVDFVIDNHNYQLSPIEIAKDILIRIMDYDINEK